MDDKLFRVLVIGGAMLGAACVQEPTPPETDAATGGDDAAVARDDGGPQADSGPAAALDGGGGDGLVECGFCPNEVCCEIDESGASRMRPGLMCCWSTSC